MAITINGTRFLAYSSTRGIQFGKTTVVGRQGLFAPPSLVRTILRRNGHSLKSDDETVLDGGGAKWADSLFYALGARELEFLDASPYEGATRLHDLNRPLEKDWEETSDTLIDAGSLEHVFDVKTAIENYLRLVRVGGHILLLDMPAINFCGHGFYQFSPEFFCEVFSVRHGFELVSLALAEDWAYAPFYSVTRPRDVRRRVELLSGRLCHLFIHARKIAPFRGFTQPVVQSDYAEAWSRTAASNGESTTRRGLIESARAAWRRIDLRAYWRFTTRRNKERFIRRNSVGRSADLTRLDI